MRVSVGGDLRTVIASYTSPSLQKRRTTNRTSARIAAKSNRAVVAKKKMLYFAWSCPSIGFTRNSNLLRRSSGHPVFPLFLLHSPDALNGRRRNSNNRIAHCALFVCKCGATILPSFLPPPSPSPLGRLFLTKKLPSFDYRYYE